ncbi:hypothetical protein BV25DRAFT_1274389 [Artomyces pyxidatus]|uniref:Uncharacterized protein n=1 Tax=Artomyces pyxidatus TaxID=48021 RepID=A0ACB8TF51_9AGAM|nr:hypothetical protein BV25DRAFT_1274389 [Artomyces pyxidatus]
MEAQFSVDGSSIILCLRLILDGPIAHFMRLEDGSENSRPDLPSAHDMLRKLGFPDSSRRRIMRTGPDHVLDIFWKTAVNASIDSAVSRACGSVAAATLQEYSILRIEVYHLPLLVKVNTFDVPVVTRNATSVAHAFASGPQAAASQITNLDGQTLTQMIAGHEAQLRDIQDAKRLTCQYSKQERLEMELSAALQQRDSNSRSAMSGLLTKHRDITLPDGWTFVDAVAILDAHDRDMHEAVDRLRGERDDKARLVRELRLELHVQELKTRELRREVRRLREERNT